MDAYIKFENNVLEEDSYNLQQLANLIEEECDLSVNIEKADAQPGVRDGGLAIGLAIASLALTAIQTLISVLQYWESKQPKYSLSVTFHSPTNKKTLLLESSSEKEIQAAMSQLQSQSSPEYVDVEVKISKKQ